MQTGGDFQRKETELRGVAEREMAAVTGRGEGEQVTTYRDKSGKRMELGEHLKEQAAIEAAAKVAEEKALKEFRRGAKQKEDEVKRRREMELLAGEGLARHVNDERLEAQLKSEMRADDPMAKYMEKVVTAREDAAGIVRKRTYRGPPPPPNRYQINPGYRWDGVHRGNGFEAKVLAKLAGRGLHNEKAHAWSTADM